MSQDQQPNRQPNPNRIHHTITEKRVLDAAEAEMFGPSLSSDGFCLACGSRQTGVEPDARHYTCRNCGRVRVFGAAEILLIGAFHPDQP